MKTGYQQMIFPYFEMFKKSTMWWDNWKNLPKQENMPDVLYLNFLEESTWIISSWF